MLCQIIGRKKTVRGTSVDKFRLIRLKCVIPPTAQDNTAKCPLPVCVVASVSCVYGSYPDHHHLLPLTSSASYEKPSSFGLHLRPVRPTGSEMKVEKRRPRNPYWKVETSYVPSLCCCFNRECAVPGDVQTIKGKGRESKVR